MSEVLVVGLVAFYIWYLLAESVILAKPLAWPREHWGPLISCGYCSSFWIVPILLVVTSDYDPVTHIAAAAVAGLAAVHSG